MNSLEFSSRLKNSFSTTMNALVRAGKCDGALAVFREMISRKLEPGLVACNFVLTNCSKHKRGEVALEFLEVMRKVPRRNNRIYPYLVQTVVYSKMLGVFVMSCCGVLWQPLFARPSCK